MSEKFTIADILNYVVLGLIELIAGYYIFVDILDMVLPAIEKELYGICFGIILFISYFLGNITFEVFRKPGKFVLNLSNRNIYSLLMLTTSKSKKRLDDKDLNIIYSIARKNGYLETIKINNQILTEAELKRCFEKIELEINQKSANRIWMNLKNIKTFMEVNVFSIFFLYIFFFLKISNEKLAVIFTYIAIVLLLSYFYWLRYQQVNRNYIKKVLKCYIIK